PELRAEADNYSRRSGEGESITGITQRRRKDGTLVDVELHGVPLMANGKYMGTYGLYQDISERKRAETALQQSEERFRSLFENATVGIYRTTPAGQILVANPALVKMLGYEN